MKMLFTFLFIPGHFQINYFLIFYSKPFQQMQEVHSLPIIKNSVIRVCLLIGVLIEIATRNDFQRKRIMILKFVPYCQRHKSFLLWNILEGLTSRLWCPWRHLIGKYLQLSTLLFTKLSNGIGLLNVAQFYREYV